MAKPTVAFDVDGTLIDEDGEPRWEVIEILRELRPYTSIIVWSGGGISYAKAQGRRLFLPKGIVYWAKPSGSLPSVDICFDDEDVKLASVNIRV